MLAFRTLIVWVFSSLFFDLIAARPGVCTGHVQKKYGPGGFKTSYRPGNRILIDKNDAVNIMVVHTPQDIGGKVTALVVYKYYRVGKKHMTRIELSIQNDDLVTRSVQIAYFLNNLKEDPVWLFTVTRPRQVFDMVCLEVERKYTDGIVTVQAF